MPSLPQRFRPRRSRVLVFVGALAASSLCGCGESHHELGGRRTVEDTLALEVPTRVRHGFTQTPGGGPFASSGHGTSGGGHGTPARAEFAWSTPAEWTAKSATRFRLASFDAPGGVDISLSVLPGRAGGVVDNVNRWRGQVGLAPLDEDGIAALPRTEVAGRSGVQLDLRGPYDAMGTTVDDARVLGVIAAAERAGQPTIFVKAVGPADAVAAQRDAFAAFVASLRREASSTVPAAPPGAGSGPMLDDVAPAAGASGGGRGLQWRLPVGWVPATSNSSMRLASFSPDGDTDLDAYIVLLPGTAGGIKANLDRWRGQVGLPPMSASQIDALPRIDVLGAPSPVLQAIGTNQGILATIATHGGTSVFVKLVGPASKVPGVYEDFLAFCRSLEASGG